MKSIDIDLKDIGSVLNNETIALAEVQKYSGALVLTKANGDRIRIMPMVNHEDEGYFIVQVAKLKSE